LRGLCYTCAMTAPLYFEDFDVGQKLSSGRYTITPQNAMAFAQEYDPQYFHVDEEAARQGIWGRLVVSGWQTAAVTMRLKAESTLGRVAGGLVGLGLETLAWPRPVYPGDTLHIVITIVDKRRSKSKPDKGVVRYRVETLNQQDALVMDMTTAVLMPLKQG
jgi:acyl dehydratase